jgi:catechol 2,3-dioxygenase-like lactoylglutathione lyase family enzyme
MGTAEVGAETGATSSVGRVDMKLEVVVIPVADVERAKRFYAGLGWRIDADFGARGVQLTPPGSACSIQFGENMIPSPPGSAQALHLIVSDIEAARDDLVAHGVEPSEVFHCAQGYGCRFPGHDGRVSGRAPGDATYGSFLTFDDPDGNGWILQEITTRFPGRVEGDTTYTSVSDLAQALRRAAAAHGQHEARTGRADPDWPNWYAEYMVKEQAGQELPL